MQAQEHYQLFPPGQDDEQGYRQKNIFQPKQEDPLRRREQFAVSLRKAKKKLIIAEKRKKLPENLWTSANHNLVEFMGHWHQRWDEFYAYCDQVLPRMDIRGHNVWPTTDTVDQLLAQIEIGVEKKDETLILAMLTVLRQIFSEVNEDKFSCLLVLKRTQLFTALNNTLLSCQDSQVVRLETLWVMLNVAYCCRADLEIDEFTKQLLEMEALRQLWLQALDLVVETFEPLSIRYQKLEMALLLLGNMFSHENAQAQFLLISELPQVFTLLTASVELLKEWPEMIDTLTNWLVPNLNKSYEQAESQDLTLPLCLLAALCQEGLASEQSLQSFAIFLENTQESQFEVSAEFIRNNLIYGIMGKSTHFEAEARVLGLICSMTNEPFQNFLTEEAVAGHVLDCLLLYYDTAVDQSSQRCLHDIFWTLANVALVVPGDSTVIANHRFWQERVCKLNIESLAGSTAVTELCAAVEAIMLPMCDEQFAYSMQAQSEDLTRLICQLLSLQRGITMGNQRGLLEVVQFMCQIEWDMFDVEEDGTTFYFEKHGLEPALESLIDRHSKLETRGELSEKIVATADLILASFLNTENKVSEQVITSI